MFSVLLAVCSIIHSSDGGVDDFATTALISAAAQKNHEIEFPAVIITNADCEPFSAFSACWKTTQFLRMNTLVGMSASRVWTQFPWEWRLASNAIDQIPCLQSHYFDASWYSMDGNSLFANTLKNSERVSIIATGPLTSIAEVLQMHPELCEKITELHWMGGALDIPGNIMESPEIPKELLNDRAEWNVFCDPQAADWVFRNTSFDIYVYPLDISEQTLPNEFMKVLNQKEPNLHTQYVSECYKLVEDVELYRMWDVVAAAGILFPEVLEMPVKEKLRIELGSKEQGAFMREPNGREVFVYKEFKNNDPSAFYEKVASILAEGF